MRPGEWISLDNGVRALPLAADHDRSETCVFYLFEVDGKFLLQANDTGWFPDATWAMLRDYSLDVVVLDSTSGSIKDGKHGHMGCNWVVTARDQMLKEGILKPEHRCIANHFSHNGGWLHEELEAYLGPQGIEVGYDGMHPALSGGRGRRCPYECRSRSTPHCVAAGLASASGAAERGHHVGSLGITASARRAVSPRALAIPASTEAIGVT